MVIGGAGGIGGAIATGFVEHGARLVMASRNIENLKLRAAAIGRETGGEATAMGVDITDEEDVIRLVGEIVARYGTVDILVNAHGANKKAKGLDLSMEDWQLLHNVNSMGTMISCKQFGRIMTKRRSGKVINLSSVRGIRANAGGIVPIAAPRGGRYDYSLSGGGVAPFNVNVNAIGPALIATKLTEKQMKEPGRTEKYLRNIPLAAWESRRYGWCGYLPGSAAPIL